jgi:pimeloyl-ACP methyl ester carboxylesterase
MKRRAFLAVASGASFAATVGCRTRPESKTAPRADQTFVLVHGAWHGGWCWREVVARLSAKGYRVFAPSLTGVGDRAHLFGPSVNLATHVEDIVDRIDMEQVDRCTLVGHSYGGNVITGVADRLRNRVGHYLFLDAVVPPDEVTSWSWSDFNTPEVKAARKKRIQDQGGRGPGLSADPPSAFAVTEPAQMAWLARNLRPMPAGTYLEPMTLNNGGSKGLKRTYITCVNPRYASLVATAERIKQDPNWNFTTIDCGHDAMVIAPQMLTNLLLALG